MNIEQIPSDEVVIMSEFWHRAFNAAGCDPECHGCYKKIPPGSPFKLATIETNIPRNIAITESREVMLCDNCKPEDVEKAKVNRAHRAVQNGGCYRINGKIVH